MLLNRISKKINQDKSLLSKEVIFLSSLLLAPGVMAQTAPDAGSLMRELEQPSMPDIDEVPTLPQDVVPPEASDGPSLPVQTFNFEGQTVFSTAELQTLVSGWLGKLMTLPELKFITDKVAQHYRKAGYLARVYLPEQNVNDGSVSITVLEARYGQVTLDGEGIHTTKLVEGMMTKRQKNGVLLSLKDLERSTLLINDIPGLTAKSVLKASEVAGQTDIVVSVTEQSVWHNSATVDNFGSRSSGKERLGYTASYDNPAKAGDEVKINALLSNGNLYARAGYSRPFGYDGLRAGASFSLLSYELTGDFDALNARGDANTLSFQVDYPLIRQFQHNIRLNGSFALRNYNNEQLGISTSEKTVNAVNIGITGDRVDGYYSGGMLLYGVSMALGELAVDKGDTESEGSYSKINLNVARLQKINDKINLWLSVRGQFASDNLDSSETMSLGGAAGVRAYPSLEASGDSGLMWTAELRYRLDQNFTLKGFIDYGKVDEEATLTQVSQSHELKGIGASLDWIEPKHDISAKISVATRIGDNPLADSVTGNDSDGSKDDYPIWFSLTKIF